MTLIVFSSVYLLSLYLRLTVLWSRRPPVVFTPPPSLVERSYTTTVLDVPFSSTGGDTGLTPIESSDFPPSIATHTCECVSVVLVVVSCPVYVVVAREVFCHERERGRYVRL